MISSKYLFRTKEIELNMPKQGKHTYLIESNNPINYAREIHCSHKKEVSISIQYLEDQPYVRSILIETKNNSFKFSDGSFAMHDIMKRTASVYNKLHLKVSYCGEIIAINNIDELTEKWKDAKAYFKSKYKGNQVQRFIFKKDVILNSEEEIIKDLLLYSNFGGLIKSMYQEYSSDQCSITQQPLSTKYGTVMIKEEFLLQSVNKTEDIQLQLRAHYPEKEEYVTINGTYNFIGLQESLLKKALISYIEKYGRQEYQSTVSITQL